MNYFQGITDLEHLKKHFRELLMKYHPDVSGFDSTREMQEINMQYQSAIVEVMKNSGFAAKEVEKEIEKEKMYKEKIESITKLDLIIIELAYKWIWVSGATYPHKETLKKNGFFWARKKQVWYWRPPDEKSRSGKGQLSLEEIRNKYDSKVIVKSDKKLL